MVIVQDYVYWSLIEQLVIEHDFSILALSTDETEILLQPATNKNISVLRLRRMDIDWGNSLAKDIQMAGEKFQQIMQTGARGPLTVFNLYISSLPPVDDFPVEFVEGYTSGTKKRVTITSLLVTSEDQEHKLIELGEALNVSIHPLEKNAQENVTIDHINEVKNRVIRQQQEIREEEKKMFQNGKPFFTYIFLAFQIVMFLVLELYGGSENTETLVNFGAKFNPYIYEGEWWRLITPIFLHIGFFHLLMNSFALYYIGPAVERAFGSLKFLLIYLIAGIGGSVASFAFSTSVSAGASGAIFGCFGALLYLGLHNRRVFFRTMGSNLLVIIGINLALGFVIPNIDNAGHIGGLIGGFLAAVIVQLPQEKKWLYRILGLLAVIGLFLGAYQLGLNVTEEEFPQLTAKKAQVLIANEEYEDAYMYLQNYLDKGQTSNDILFLLSYVEIQLEKQDQAIKHLEEIILSDETFHEAHFNLALLYERKGEAELARKQIAQALKYDPTNQSYQAFEASLTD
ncbi:rhomboid family intramembrane serine protease [Bacillus weihaiensis]|uniref:Peptidase S54 rhomboid domain-containing protein n=1 Tax=Bacillus weihaiensis TaxID=1547283 RepID=A0A1L3MPX1_9BACI|nr:rhomboid family intramembrane serine protease [Bacillus weihaiensis]APH04385.1 hypothetical protein A9C19_06280 [Bacillus weihaiensis]